MPRNNFGKTKNKNARRLAAAGDITNTFFRQDYGTLLPDPQPVPPVPNPATMTSGQPPVPAPAASITRTQPQLPRNTSLGNDKLAWMGSVVAVKSVFKHTVANEMEELKMELKSKMDKRYAEEKAAWMKAPDEADKRAATKDAPVKEEDATKKKKAKGKGRATCEYATKKAGTKKPGKFNGPAPTGKGVFLPGFAEGENPHRGKFNFGNCGGWMGDLEQMMAIGMKK